jgi:hypothetical protein
MLILIVVFGLASIGFARYDYRNPPAGPTKYFAALALFACGEGVSSLAPSVGNYAALAGGVVESTTTGSPTLNQFTSAYPGLELTSSTLQLPATSAKNSHVRTYKNGETCAKGTKDAGKAGHIEIAYWPTLGSPTPTLTTDPSSVPLGTRVQISVAFIPTGVTPPRPPSSVIAAMETAIQTAATATTTTSTTLGAATTTTAKT